MSSAPAMDLAAGPETAFVKASSTNGRTTFLVSSRSSLRPMNSPSAIKSQWLMRFKEAIAALQGLGMGAVFRSL